MENVSLKYKKPMVLLSALSVICGIFAFASRFYAFDTTYNLFSKEYETLTLVKSVAVSDIIAATLMLIPLIFILLYSIWLYKTKSGQTLLGIINITVALSPLYTVFETYRILGHMTVLDIVSNALIIIPFIVGGIYTIYNGKDFTLCILGPVFGAFSYIINLPRDVYSVQTLFSVQAFLGALRIITTILAMFSLFAVIILSHIREK